VRSEPDYLRLRATPGNWRIYEVRRTGAMLSLGAGAEGRLVSLGPESFVLAVSRPGDFVLRVRGMPYWRIAAGAGCVGRAGDWTLVRATRPGVLRVVARFTPGRAWRAAIGGAGKCRASPVTVF
jgi:hypothetical protein